jgi:hypothetical protein
MVMKNHWRNVRNIVACFLASVLIYPGLAAAGDNDQDTQTIPVKLIKGARPISDEPAQRVFYISYDKNEEELQTVHARLVKAGARAISVIVPDAIVCELPLRVDPGEVLDGMNMMSRVQPLGGITRAPALPGDLDWLRVAYDTIDDRLEGGGPNKQSPAAGAADRDLGGLAEVSGASIERSAYLARKRLESPDPAAAQDAPFPDQNSEFFAGDIHIQVVFVEVKDSHNWTTAEENEVKTALEFVKMYYERHFRNVSADFTSRTFKVGIGWDPMNNGLNESIDIPPLMREIMSRMDYVGEESEYMEKVNDFNNDARLSYVNTDWVFTIFVVDSSEDPNWSFESKKQMYAAVGGPFMILAYPTMYPGSSTFESFVKHGITLIFWGLPEDLGSYPGNCGDRSGYLNLPHLNKTVKNDPLAGPRDCDNEYPDQCTANLGDMTTGVPCNYTMGHMGNVDIDNDNVPDIFDAAPNVIFWGSDIDTLFSLEDPIKLSVRSRPVINKNSWQQHELINYATEIERVSYTLNSAIGPLLVIPVDGVADELIEQYVINVPFLLPGTSSIEVTAWNNFGAKSNPKAKNLFFVALDFWSFRFEHTNDGVGIAWYLRGETFNDPPDNPLELELHRIDPADSSDTIIAGPDVLVPIGPQNQGLTPYFFLDRTAVAGNHYRYYVAGKFDILYRDEIVEITSESDVYETVASLPREGGILSIPAPNPFQPLKGTQKLLMSVDIPGVEGIPLVTRSGGINRTPAQQQIPEPIGLKVGVYDVAGHEIKILFDEAVYAPVVNVEWDGKNKNGQFVSSGMYFIKARASEITDTRKVLVIR